jgi:2-dehydropantoate 2-reductase
MKIACMAAGGVGGYFGARLQQAGHDVVFFARGRHLKALREKGLSVRSRLGNADLKVAALEDPKEAGTPDVVLFAVKLWDTESAAQQLVPIVGKGTLVIPFQNGVESIERLRKILPPECVMGGSAYIATRIAEPGVIEHTGEFARMVFGPLAPAQRPAAEKFLAACRQAKITAELADDIVRVNWEKFVFLVAISGTCAVARAPVAVVRADPDLRWALECAMRETWQVARRRGVALADDFVEKQMALADGFPAGMRPSLLHDLEAGHRLEAPWLCGAVARMAREAGLEAPVNRSVYAALKPFVDGSQIKAS